MPHPATLFAAALIATVAASSALACSSVSMWAKSYLRCGGSDECRESKLVELSHCGGYFGKRSDRLLLPVLKDAVSRDLKRSLVQRVFDRYRCVPGARDVVGYKTVRAALDTRKCPNMVVFRRWFELRGGGAANLRAAPSRSSRKVGYVKKGHVVERIAISGDWYKVISWAGVSRVTGYIHASLLVRY